LKKLLLLFLCLTANIGFCQQGYYSDVTLTKTGVDLKDELAIKIIATHSNFLSYTPGVWEACKVTDLDPNDVTDSNVLLIYGYSDSDGNYITDRTRSKNDNGGDNGTDWNREHTYPKALGNPNLGTSGPGSDAHHLRASDVQMNANRGSFKFASGNGNAGNSNGGWYPGDEWKGDAARIIMYMYLRYGDQCLPSNVTIGTTNSVDNNMIDLLLDWNEQDPVSTYEDNRNTYHENTSNTYAQGNRNPFIDNPNLATQIWGGTPAEDRWNTTPDTENPSDPANLVASNITNTTVDLNWTPSTDDVAVTTYEIHVDGALYTTATTNSKTVSGLTIDTEYDFTVYAKDAAGNTSAASNIATITTDNFIDNEAPSAITDLMASNATSNSTDLNWTAATDNVAVTSYEIFQDGSFLASSTTNSYNVISLTSETSYNFTVYSKDAAGNTSLVSNTEMITTLEAPIAGTTCGTETFTNATETPTSGYGDGSFIGDNSITWTYVQARDDQGFEINGTGLMLRDLISNSKVTSATISGGIENFTCSLKKAYTGVGDRQVELFVNGESKGTSIAWDNTNVQEFSVNNINIEGDIIIEIKNISEKQLIIDDVSWICYSSSLSTPDFIQNLFSVFPNPTTNNSVTIRLNNNIELSKIEFYNTLGQLIISKNKPKTTNNSFEIDHVPSGMYIVKIQSETTYSTKRLIVE